MGIPADVDFKSAHFSSSRRFFERNCCVSKTVCIGMLLASSAQPQQGCQPPPPPHHEILGIDREEIMLNLIHQRWSHRDFNFVGNTCTHSEALNSTFKVCAKMYPYLVSVLWLITLFSFLQFKHFKLCHAKTLSKKIFLGR